MGPVTKILEKIPDLNFDFNYIGVEITQKGDDLLGKERFVADGLVTEEECKTLIELARVGYF